MTDKSKLAVRSPEGLASLAVAKEKAREYARAAKSQSTQRAYRRAWGHFSAWCEAHGETSLPASAETLASYIAHLAAAGRKPAGIAQSMAAISQAHHTTRNISPRHSPEVRAVWQGICNTHGTAPTRKRAAVTADIRRMVETFSSATLLGIRNRAILATGFAGAFRRSEIVALDHEDLSKSRDGYRANLRRSKTDQEGQGRMVALSYGHPPTCPVTAIDAWLALSGIVSGPLFVAVNRYDQLRPGVRLDGQTVARIVKMACAATGLPAEYYSGHSLRAGLVTSAAEAGKSLDEIMSKTGHKNSDMVMRYIREANVHNKDPAKDVT